MPMKTILGVTRQGDDPKGPLSGLLYRDLDPKDPEAARLRWVAMDAVEADPTVYEVMTVSSDLPKRRAVSRVERTVRGVPRLLVPGADGKLGHTDLADKLLFSEANKALLTPQKLGNTLPFTTLVIEYLEITRLVDVARREMLGGERTVGELTTVLGILPTEATLAEVLWRLARGRWLRQHEMGGKPGENVLAIESPWPSEGKK